MTPNSLWWSGQVISLRWMYSLRPKHNLKTIINPSRNKQSKKTLLQKQCWRHQVRDSSHESFILLGDEQITHQPSSPAWTCALGLLFHSCLPFPSSASFVQQIHYPSSACPNQFNLDFVSSDVLIYYCVLPSHRQQRSQPSVFSYLDHASQRILLKTDSKGSGIFYDNVKIWWSMLVLR